MNNALVVLSGGQDSTTCLFLSKREFQSVRALTFSYNQRHSFEIESARIIAKMAAVEHEVIDMGPIFAGLSPLTNRTQEVMQYDSAQKLPGGLEATFVPGRNILFLVVAANRAYVTGCDHLVLGVSEEDFGGYPDCREDFMKKMEAALVSGLDMKLSIYTPLMHLNKRQTVELAKTLPGCMEALAYSTTCYKGSLPPCGHCHACLLRERGFREANTPDPLLERLRQGASSYAG